MTCALWLVTCDLCLDEASYLPGLSRHDTRRPPGAPCDAAGFHVDVGRARRDSPFGGPIAHGSLTLALVAPMTMALGPIPPDAASGLNYGLDKVRFVAPVRAGARVRNRAIAACPTFFPGEGCSLSTSYVNVFYDRFWRDLHDEWSAIDRTQDDDRRDAKLNAFYREHRDRFVDSYAATSPVEDIAETWAFFILDSQPAGTSEIDQKLGFFYSYPELVTLRSHIIGNLCAENP